MTTLEDCIKRFANATTHAEIGEALKFSQRQKPILGSIRDPNAMARRMEIVRAMNAAQERVRVAEEAAAAEEAAPDPDDDDTTYFSASDETGAQGPRGNL